VSATGIVNRTPGLVRHPVPVAIIACALAVAVFVVYPVGPNAFVAAGVAGALVVVSATDLERRIIPNRIVLPALAIVLLERIVVSPDHAPEYIVAMLGAALFLLLPNLVNDSAIGMGDVKLAALLGATLGWNVINALTLGFLLMVPVAIAVLVRGGMAARKTALPFGPFIALGGIVFLIFPHLLGTALV
jgi:prepilin signal peptidase PulO-like enzyme (type II secretory pathway)